MLRTACLFSRTKYALALQLYSLPKFSSKIQLFPTARSISAFARATPLIGRFKFKGINSIATTLFSSAMVATTTGADTKPVEYFRLDYKPSPFSISKVHLSFDLDESNTVVTSTSTIVRQSSDPAAELTLDGEELELLEVQINGAALSADQYKVVGDKLVIPPAGMTTVADKKEFTLVTKVRIYPDKNLALSGLYKSGSSKLLCTQCEAMGFRRITYHMDRPDILSVYTVRLEADKDKFPLLLSNGNQVDKGEVPGTNRHWTVWEDPFLKPSYLFALVAADLGSIHSTYTTTSGKVVQLGIYSDKENQNQLDHAMYSLKESMRWDEDTFGLECDLDVYNVVATNDFNMGAMENKGLNIFNSAYVLADPATATDTDFERILGVIGHEYFHNWSGNRVTVRDWFQLTLKEGLTVFRDQWFTSDMTSHAVKRIEDVRGLRSRQFAEDAGPMAHPIRPESYISMDNFYTSTVYSKGAEIVGLYKTLLGDDGFKKGMKLYIERHDGTAVTCDDFRNAMADANGVDLSQMDRWYSQAGTPVVTVQQQYDASSKKFSLMLSQYTPSTPGQTQEEKLPVVIPVVVGLLDSASGKEIVPSTVLKLTEATQTFHFENVENKPVASVLRGFSAPVNLEFDQQTDEDLIFLMGYDTDSFNKWDAGNRYFTKLLLSMADMPMDAIDKVTIPENFINAIKLVLESAKKGGDMSLVAYALQMPDTMTLLNQLKSKDVDRLHKARKFLKETIATKLYAEFEEIYTLSADAGNEYKFNPQEVGRRRLHNTCLEYLTAVKNNAQISRAKYQFDSSNCMTDKVASLSCLASLDCPERKEAMEQFLIEAAGNALVINKWFMIQAMADYDGLINDVIALKSHPDFIISNPNRARSLISAFSSNLYHFHKADGSGYKFLADCIIELDKLNPQVSARMVSSFAQWKLFDERRSALQKEQLERIQAQEKLSPDTYEVVLRCLK